MLDERKSAILKAVVTEYIETAQPVGSAHVVRDAAIDVSPATVRADMATLEREGYLNHPHTSAGRIPTDKGYRYFVDKLCGIEPLRATDQQTVQEFFSTTHGELEKMLRETATLLSMLTNYAAVVIGPDREVVTVRSALFVRLAPRTGLLVVVHSNAAVDKRIVEISEDDADEAVARVGERLNAHLTGKVLTEAEPPPLTHDQAHDRLTAACWAVRSDMIRRDEQVYFDGASNMARAFDAVDTVRSVLTMLEKTYVVVDLLQDALAHERNVSIGGEHGGALSQCSIVVAPYEIDNSVVGTVGVLGPTRMNYPQALAAVAVVSGRLGRELSGI
jgi:heat-inducible transcriptional repressor